MLCRAVFLYLSGGEGQKAGGRAQAGVAAQDQRRAEAGEAERGRLQEEGPDRPGTL